MSSKRKPTLAQLKKRPAWWIAHGYDLRITMPGDNFALMCQPGTDDWWPTVLNLKEIVEWPFYDFGGWL